MSSKVYRNPGPRLRGLVEISYGPPPEISVRALEAIPVTFDRVTGEAVVRCLCFDQLGVGDSPAEARRRLEEKVGQYLLRLIKEERLETTLHASGWVETPQRESPEDALRAELESMKLPVLMEVEATG